MSDEQRTDDIVVRIYADRINEPPHAMRKDIDRDALFELAEDIKKNGLINPITVRPIHVQPSNEAQCFAATAEECKSETHRRFEVVAGHRRYLACGIAQIVQIPCVVRELDDATAF